MTCKDGKHDAYTAEELEKDHELVNGLLAKNGVPEAVRDGKPCRACRSCGQFFYEEEGERLP